MTKKILLTATLLIFGYTQLTAQNDASEKSFYGGIKVEANTAFFLLSDFDEMTSNPGMGVSLGGFLKFDLSSHIALQPEILIHFKSSETKLNNIKNDLQYWGLEIPLYIVGQWQTNKGHRFHIGAGPYGSFGLSAKYKEGDLDLYDEDNNNIHLDRWDLGAGISIGYEFANGLQINAGHKFGFLNALKNGQEDAFMRNQTVSLGIGFRF